KSFRRTSFISALSNTIQVQGQDDPTSRERMNTRFFLCPMGSTFCAATSLKQAIGYVDFDEAGQGRITFEPDDLTAFMQYSSTRRPKKLSASNPRRSARSIRQNRLPRVGYEYIRLENDR